jgi:protein tyrosine phosphatase (PTP) superfamily phosphohydrolase (DUF442 family)
VAASALQLQPGVSDAKMDPDTTSTGKSFAQMEPEPGIRRFAEICPGLARGGDPGEEGLRYLRDKGYRTIVSFLPSQDESAFVVHSGMKYVHIPMHSGPFSAEPPTDEQVRQFLSVVKDTTQYPIFIHCHAGKDRTGAMSAIYRMDACGWTTDEAVQEMKAFGFAGRYKRLFKYVRDYSARQPKAPLAPEATTTESQTSSASPSAAPSDAAGLR